MKKNPPNASTVYENYFKAVKNLKRSLSTPVTEPRDLSGILKDFEMAYELSWKALKKYLLSQGNETQGAKDVYTKAFQLGYIEQEKIWLEMINDRNQTSHVYDEAEARQIAERINKAYLSILEKLTEKFK